MEKFNLVSSHYSQGEIVKKVQEGIRVLGKSLETITSADLATVDEFHVGGRDATINFFNRFPIDSEDRVLDLGCGIGGTARLLNEKIGCKVIGVDLTREYVEAGNALSGWLRIRDDVELIHGNILSLDFEDCSFEAVTMMHVGMNIEEKERLASEVYRVLRPGGKFALYDIMKVGNGSILYPVPWATSELGSFVDTPDVYRSALVSTGFRVQHSESKKEFALEFFEKVKAAASNMKCPPPLGLHILMGHEAKAKYSNMMNCVINGSISPYEMVAVRP